MTSIAAGGRVLRELESSVRRELARVGLLCRVFGRVKSVTSLRRKIEEKGYSREHEKRLQDLVGIRITAYFSDDIELVSAITNGLFSEVERTIDRPEEAVFGPTRFNIVYRMNDELWQELVPILPRPVDAIDSTFEVQLRTVLSEGWHEIEHDLRYKRRSDWADEPELNRALNGLVATLETCDWSTLQLFDRLAYRHYKAARWEAMIHTKFRIRFTASQLSPCVVRILDREPSVARAIVRLSRRDLLSSLYAVQQDYDVPLTMDNLVFLANRKSVDIATLRAEEPLFLRPAFERMGAAPA